MNETTSRAVWNDLPVANSQPSEHLLILPQILGKQAAVYLRGGQEMFRGELWTPPTDPFISGVMVAMGRIVVEAQRRQQYWNMTLVGMRESIRTLTHEVTMLKVQIQQLQNARTFVVPLTTLAPEPFRMTQQIPVTIEGDGEDFTATFMEANVSASGETEADAIANFKDSLLSSYEVLEGLSPSQLGPLPARQWGILKSVVQRTE